MQNGLITGIVKDNEDPDGMHRVLVEFPVDAQETLESSWCRMITPMAGTDRGLVMLPDVGTEVVLGFAYRSLTPIIMGAVYNGGDDKPEPYRNDDEDNDKRVFWSRNDHMVIFDDTSGSELVALGAQASTRLDVSTGPIHQTLDSAGKTITEYCDGDTEHEAGQTISIKCTDFKLEASMNVEITSGADTNIKSGVKTDVTAAAVMTIKAPMTAINPSAPPPDPQGAETFPSHKHPPTS